MSYSYIDELAGEISGHPIGGGYYATQVGMDDARDIAADILVAGYRKQWVITTSEDLAALPDGTYIKATNPFGDSEVALKSELWCFENVEQAYDDGWLISEYTNITVLHEPEA